MKKLNGRDGFTLLELMAAAAILSVVVAGTLMFVTRSLQHQEYMHELELAEENARAVVETVQYYADTTFPNLVKYFNADPNDDVDGPGTAPGDTFYDRSVPGLPVASTSPTGQLIEITLHTNETEVYPALNLPRDLNGDGDALDTDVSASFKLMPVTVTIHWRSQKRDVTTKMETLTTKH